MNTYAEDDYLQLSGIQHFCFCRRQWALIHIEQQWADNLRTVEGEILHEHAHNDRFSEKRGDLLVVRGLAIHSAALGVSGVCDVVEFHASPEGVPLFHHRGTWLPTPVEYKRGAQNRQMRTACSCAAKGCVWKRCWPVMSPRDTSFMEKPAEGKRYCLRKPFEIRCGKCFSKCTAIIAAAILQKLRRRKAAMHAL